MPLVMYSRLNTRASSLVLHETCRTPVRRRVRFRLSTPVRPREKPGRMRDCPNQDRMTRTNLRGCRCPECDYQASDETRLLLDHALDHSVPGWQKDCSAIWLPIIFASESSLNALARKFSVAFQDYVRPAPVLATGATITLITKSRAASVVRTANTVPETWSTIQRYGAVFSPVELSRRTREVKRYDVVPFLLRILSPLSPVRILRGSRCKAS